VKACAVLLSALPSQAAMIPTRCCALCFFVRLAQREEAPAPVVFQAKNIATQWTKVYAGRKTHDSNYGKQQYHKFLIALGGKNF